MRRSFLVAVVWLNVGLLATAGCGDGSSSSRAGQTEAPPLAQISTVPVLPSSSRPPGPAVTAACPLLPPAKIAAALKMGKPHAVERQGTAAYHNCHYQAGAQYIDLWVNTEPASGTADQAAALSIKRYTGTLESLPGLGDAAYYTSSPATGGPTVQSLVVARAEGTQMRLVTLVGFLNGEPKDTLVALVRSVLARI